VSGRGLEVAAAIALVCGLAASCQPRTDDIPCYDDSDCPSSMRCSMPMPAPGHGLCVPRAQLQDHATPDGARMDGAVTDASGTAEVANAPDSGDAGDAGATETGPWIVDGSTADRGTPDGPIDAGTGLPPPQQIWPLSTTFVTTVQPTLSWKLQGSATGAEIQLAQNPTFNPVAYTIDQAGSSVALQSRLSAGVWFWRIAACTGSCTGRAGPYGPGWELSVGAITATRQSSYGGFFDVNGDGYSDLAVTDAAGTIFVFTTDTTGIHGPQTIRPPGAGSLIFYVTLANAGDTDGDGYPDLIVGEPSVGSTGTIGRAVLYHGGPSGIRDSTSPTLLMGDGAGSGELGLSVSAAGDFNADGFGDVAVGEPGAMEFWIFYGAAPGSVGPPPMVVPRGVSGFGSGLANASGFGGSSTYGAVAVGATGTSYVYFGQNTVPPYSADTISYGNGPVADLGDIDDDGYTDLAVGNDSPGGVNVYSGAAFPTPSSLAVPSGSSNFGEFMASIGDADGDGKSDAVMGGGGTGSAYAYAGAQAPPYVLSDGNASNEPVAGTGPGFLGSGSRELPVVSASSSSQVFYFTTPLSAGGGTPKSLPTPSGANGFGLAIAGVN
jgi:hypothetical protein